MTVARRAMVDSGLNGLLTCAKYAFAPNRLKYCGPGDRNKEIYDYCIDSFADQGLENLLKKFEVLYPYLKLIASYNGIDDPFDFRVVEAYWIGNELLENVEAKQIYEHLLYGIDLKRKYDRKSLELIFGKLATGVRVHHSYHVLNVFQRSGIEDLPHTLSMMQNCMISWGQVKDVKGETREIQKVQLILKNGRLTLEKDEVEFTSNLGKFGFVADLRVGDWVSMHWGWLCDRLSLRQVSNLAKYTKWHVNLANRNL